MKLKHDDLSGANERDNFVVSDFEVRQPEGLEQMPLIPFLNICKFLKPGDIFRSLSLTCKPLNYLVEGSQFPLRKLNISSSLTVEELLMLRHKVSSCRVMDILWSSRTQDSFWHYAMGLLLDKFKHSLTAMVCTADCWVQTLEFLEITTKLRGLFLVSPIEAMSWDWDKQKPCYSLEVLLLIGRDYSSSRILLILSKLPNLLSVSFWDRGDPIYDEKDFRDRRVVTRLRCYESKIMLSYLQLSWVEKLGLYPVNGFMLKKFMEEFPSLSRLRQVRLMIKPQMMNGMLDATITSGDLVKITDLIRILSQSKILEEVRIELKMRQTNFPRGEEVVKELLQLPENVQIIYFNFDSVRSPFSKLETTLRIFSNDFGINDRMSEIRAFDLA
jgi:hypothetical protein